MEKEFEALKRIRQETSPATYMPDFDKGECCDVIEQALTELKQIKEAKPSEAMECLDELFDSIMGERLKQESKKYKTIKPALLKAQELEKENAKYKEVLRIIKEKGYEEYMFEEFDNFEAYKKNMDKFYADQFVIDWNDKKQLVELRIYTEEEFDLVRRVLR